MLNRTTGIAEIVAVNKQGIKIIGYLNKLGIIIFIPPKETASVTPDWLTFQELITRTTVVQFPLRQHRRQAIQLNRQTDCHSSDW